MDKYCGIIALIGLPNSGKSSILNKLVGQKLAPVTYKANTTRQFINGILTLSNKQFIFTDTPGMLDRKFIPKADIFLWVANSRLKPEKPPISLPKNTLLILNKIDLFKKKTDLLPVISDWKKLINPSEILLFSAKTGDGFNELIETLASKLEKREFVFDKEIITDSTERDIVSELIREKILLTLNKEIPYLVKVKIELFDEARRNDPQNQIIFIFAILEVFKKMHKPILIGKQGIMLKKIGSMARKDLELLLNCKIMLNLSVQFKEI